MITPPRHPVGRREPRLPGQGGKIAAPVRDANDRRLTGNVHLAQQAADVHVHEVARRIEIVAPDVPEQDSPADDLSGPLREIGEQPQFAR